MEPRQLRYLQALWCRWGGSLGLLPEADRQLRHYYIQIITKGRVGETRDLDGTDADAVIQWLRERVRHGEAAQNYAAGTAMLPGAPRSAAKHGGLERALGLHEGARDGAAGSRALHTPALQ